MPDIDFPANERVSQPESGPCQRYTRRASPEPVGTEIIRTVYFISQCFDVYWSRQVSRVPGGGAG